MTARKRGGKDRGQEGGARKKSGAGRGHAAKGPAGPRVLIVGGGGREHALAWKLRAERRDLVLLAAPGNPGIAEVATRYDVAATDIEKLVDLATREKVDLVVVGPEAPLELGLVDRLREARIPAFGPTRAAARLESSKVFAKQIMSRAGVPTARAEVYTDAGEARRGVRQFGVPVVVKASGLAAGKGVVICHSMGEAYEAIDMMLLARGMGEAGAEILLEEFMEGEELSLFYLTDGERAMPLVPAQDHKRLKPGDAGPNTGGMGAYAPVSIGTPALVEEVTELIVRPTLAAMRDDGTPFTGLLYVGLMLTAQGPQVVEFNCRFGDPETQAILPLIELQPTLFELMQRIALGEGLPDTRNLTTRGHAVTTVVAASGYPERPRVGDRVTLPSIDDRRVQIFHAGTRRTEFGELQSAGGRVVTVTAVAETLADAQRLSRENAEKVSFFGAQYRPDIGWRELARLEPALRSEAPKSAGAPGD